jgi:hypothetical protein
MDFGIRLRREVIPDKGPSCWAFDEQPSELWDQFDTDRRPAHRRRSSRVRSGALSASGGTLRGDADVESTCARALRRKGYR